MNINLDQLLSTIIAAAAGAFGAYVAIRTDLADLKARMILAEKSTDQAHDRIDKILSKD
jgi:hypothetical protein